MKPIPSSMIAVFLLLAAVCGAAAQDRVVQLTEDPEEIYLPPEIQIQDAVRLEDGRVLVVWGTTAEDSAGMDRTVLVYQFADSSGLHGSPEPLTSPEANPTSRIILHCRTKRCLALWYDARSDNPGTYARYISAADGSLSSEHFISPEYFIESWTPVEGVTDSSLLIISFQSNSLILQTTDSDDRIDVKVAVEQEIIRSFDLEYGEYAMGLMLRDTSVIPVKPDGTMDPLKRIPAGRLLLPMEIGALDDVWLQQDSLLLHYTSLFALAPDSTIQLPGGVRNGIIFAGIERDTVLVHMIHARYDTSWVFSPDTYRDYVIFSVAGVVNGDSISLQTDTTLLKEYMSDIIDGGGYPNRRSWDLRRTDLIRGYYNESVVGIEVLGTYSNSRVSNEFTVVFPATPDSRSLDIGEADTNVVLRTRHYAVAVAREDRADASVVSVKPGTGKLELRASTSLYHPDHSVFLLSSYVRDNRLFVNYNHSDAYLRDGAMCIGTTYEIDPATLDVVDSIPAPCLEIVRPPARARGVGELLSSTVRSGYTFDNVGNFAVAMTYCWRRELYEEIPRGISSPAFAARSRNFVVSSTEGFSTLPEPLNSFQDELYFEEPLDLYRSDYGWDPNSGELWVLTNWGEAYSTPRYSLLSMTDLTGAVHTPSISGYTPFFKRNGRFIPVGNARYCVVTASVLFGSFGDTLAMFDVSLPNSFSQRLYGESFIRSGSVGDRYRLEVRSLDGELRAAREIEEQNVVQVVAGGPDSAIVIWSLAETHLILRFFNQELVESPGSPVTVEIPPTKSLYSPFGQFIGDRLFLLWAGVSRESGHQEAFLSSIQVPAVPHLQYPVDSIDTSSVDGTDSEEEDVTPGELPDVDEVPEERGRPLPIPYISRYADHVTLSLYPNPTSGDLHIPIRLGVDWHVEITVIDELGRVVHREESQGKVGENHFLINVSHLHSGAYVVRLAAGEGEGLGRIWVNATP